MLIKQFNPSPRTTIYVLCPEPGSYDVVIQDGGAEYVTPSATRGLAIDLARKIAYRLSLGGPVFA